MKLDEVPDGGRIFVDANIFIYHFSRLSAECRSFLLKDLSPEARVEIAFEQYEDEDASVDVYPPSLLQAEEVRRLEQALGERCNDILLDTGLFIIGAVQD